MQIRAGRSLNREGESGLWKSFVYQITKFAHLSLKQRKTIGGLEIEEQYG